MDWDQNEELVEQILRTGMYLQQKNRHAQIRGTL